MDKKRRKELIEELFKDSNIEDLDDFNSFFKEVTRVGMESLLEGEMTDHLGYEKHNYQSKNTTNSRNGHTGKTVKGRTGEFPIEIPRDREGSFEPKLVKKHQKDLAGLDDKIISMYAKGMTTRDIQAHIEDIYGYKMSHETISNMTDKVLSDVKEWQERPLETMYPIVFMDATFLKMRKDGRVRNMAIYGIIGVRLDGRKECLGLWIAETESASFWLTVMNSMKNRGVEDVLIFAVDGLKGLSEAIASAFPLAEIQKCIVHQVRNSCKHVSWKDRKELVSDLKTIYHAPSEELAEQSLHAFSEKWDKKYAYISKSWRDNWGDIITFFKFPDEVRRLIYTTNPIESFNRGLKKVTKNRAVFPNETALMKLLFLAVRDISKKWTGAIRNWATIFSQLMIFFEDRLKPYIK